MSVQHKEDSIKELRDAEQANQELQVSEAERDAILLELDYKLMLLEKGIAEGGI